MTSPQAAEIDLAALRALIEAATPLPWKSRPSIHGSQYRFVQIGRRDDYTTLELEPEDAVLIVAAVNALPGLIAALEAALADAQRLDWLERELEREQSALLTNGTMPGSLFRRNLPITRAAIDAAKDAEKLQTEDQGAWVPVSERRPTDEGEYLCAYRHAALGHLWCMDVVRYSTVFGSFSLKFDQTVTHWMALPAPPSGAALQAEPKP